MGKNGSVSGIQFLWTFPECNSGEHLGMQFRATGNFGLQGFLDHGFEELGDRPSISDGLLGHDARFGHAGDGIGFQEIEHAVDEDIVKPGDAPATQNFIDLSGLLLAVAGRFAE